jgi:hypothetical protein
MRGITSNSKNIFIKGGALYFVIFLLFLMTILLTTFILFVYYKNQLLICQAGISQIEQNIESAVELYSVKPEILAQNIFAEINLFPETSSKTSLKKDFWGAYQIITITSKFKEISRTRLALFGCKYGSIEPIALYMSDKNRYLSVSGKSEIRGVCYLPKFGIRTARIEGQLFDGYLETRNNYIRNSKEELPAPPEYLISNCESYLSTNGNAKVKRSESLVGRKDIFNSFSDSLIIYTSNDSIWKLDNISITGKIQLLSSKEIDIGSSAKLQNIIVVGRKIIVRSGFEGHLQIFATDTVILEENTRLLYPSVVSVIGNKNVTKFIHIKKNSEVQGAVWIKNSSKDDKHTPFIKIETGSKVKGQVYAPGKIQTQGVIWGTLFTDTFILNTPVAYYENYIFNTTINGEKLPENFACLPFVFDYNEMQFTDWLF